MFKLSLISLVFLLAACASGTMEVERCLPGELGCKKQVYSKYYRGEQMTRDGSIRLIASAALGEKNVAIADQILYSVGTHIEESPAKKGNIKLYANNMTGETFKLELGEIHVVMTDNNQRFKNRSQLELGPYETRELTALAKDIENFSTKFIVTAVIGYNGLNEEIRVEANRLSVEQLKQIQKLERPL